MTSTMCAFVMVAQAALGIGGHHSRSVGCCGECGMEQVFIANQIQILQTSPRWRSRDNAAHALRKVDWKCHPVVATALVQAMLTDCEEEVREEAAETLAKLAPCLPEVHMALAQAAEHDPDHATRKWARRGLKALGKKCEGACQVCGPVSGPTVVEPPLLPFSSEPTAIEPQVPSVFLSPDPLPPSTIPPSGLPEPMPGTSPFLEPSEVSPPSLPEPPAIVEPPLDSPLSSKRPPVDSPLSLKRRKIRPLSLLRDLREDLRDQLDVSKVSDRTSDTRDQR